MACRPYNTGRCLLLRLFNPSKLWGSLHRPVPMFLSRNTPRTEGKDSNYFWNFQIFRANY